MEEPQVLLFGKIPRDNLLQEGKAEVELCRDVRPEIASSTSMSAL